MKQLEKKWRIKRAQFMRHDAEKLYEDILWDFVENNTTSELNLKWYKLPDLRDHIKGKIWARKIREHWNSLQSRWYKRAVGSP